MGEYAVAGRRRRLSVLGIISCCLALVGVGVAKLDAAHWYSFLLALTAAIAGALGLVLALGRRETEVVSPIVGLVLSAVALGMGVMALIGAGTRALNAAFGPTVSPTRTALPDTVAGGQPVGAVEDLIQGLASDDPYGNVVRHLAAEHRAEVGAKAIDGSDLAPLGRALADGWQKRYGAPLGTMTADEFDAAERWLGKRWVFPDEPPSANRKTVSASYIEREGSLKDGPTLGYRSFYELVAEEGRWRISLKFAVDGAKLHDTLKQGLGDFVAHPEAWPAERKAAYGMLIERVFMPLVSKENVSAAGK